MTTQQRINCGIYAINLVHFTTAMLAFVIGYKYVNLFIFVNNVLCTFFIVGNSLLTLFMAIAYCCYKAKPELVSKLSNTIEAIKKSLNPPLSRRMAISTVNIAELIMVMGCAYLGWYWSAILLVLNMIAYMFNHITTKSLSRLLVSEYDKVKEDSL